MVQWENPVPSTQSPETIPMAFLVILVDKRQNLEMKATVKTEKVGDKEQYKAAVEVPFVQQRYASNRQ